MRREWKCCDVVWCSIGGWFCRVGENKQDRAAIENYLLLKMLIAGVVTVTIVSVVIAGLAVNFV